jgi:hypothetical protein
MLLKNLSDCTSDSRGVGSFLPSVNAINSKFITEIGQIHNDFIDYIVAVA